MLTIRFTLVLLAGGVSIWGAWAAQSNPRWYEPQPIVSMKTSEEVKQELNGTHRIATRHGTSGMSREDMKQQSIETERDDSATRNRDTKQSDSAPRDTGKTREEVVNEYLNMTPEEKQRLRDMYPGG